MPLIDGTVKQFLLIKPEALKQAGPSTRLVHNTDGGRLLGYRRLNGYGEHFEPWASADGSAVAWCGPSLGFRTRIRQRLCLAELVAQLRAEAGQ